MTRVCPRDIYSHTVRDMDRQIVAPTHDRKETRSATPQLGPAVPAGPHPEHDAGNHPRVWRPVRCQARPGWNGSVPAECHVATNRNKSGAPFQYAELLFAVLAVIKLITELPHSQVFEGHA